MDFLLQSMEKMIFCMENHFLHFFCENRKNTPCKEADGSW